MKGPEIHIGSFTFELDMNDCHIPPDSHARFVNALQELGGIGGVRGPFADNKWAIEVVNWWDYALDSTQQVILALAGRLSKTSRR